MKFLSAHRLRLVPVCIISATAVAALVAPGAADAVGGTVGTQCSGSEITGQGAAIAIVAEEAWVSGFKNPASKDKYACTGKTGDKKVPVVNYDGTSSGAGLRSWGAEDKSPTEISFGPTNAFVNTGEAPNATQQADILKQESTDTANTLETLPVAQFALTVYVNLPAGCTATSTPTPGRLVLSDTTLQKIYNDEITTWGGITDSGDAVSPSTCDADAIVPVVRGEKAGTTNVLKKYLGLINTGTVTTSEGAKTWDALSEGKPNVVWPSALPIVKTTVEGDAAEAEKVAATPGSIGYSNLAELRVTNLFSGTGNGADTGKFWVEIQDGSKGKGAKAVATYQDPSSNGDVGAVGSANCKKTAFTNGASSFPPPSVTGLWNEVTTSITAKEKTYSLCNFVYALAFTEYSLLPGTSEAEATTVHNYLRFVADKKGGQAELQGNDYYGDPKEVATEFVDGANEIGF
jgi:ABC-type phosphate transport system substrate-binding protein